MAAVPALFFGPAPADAQPIDVPPSWGGDIWSRPRLTGDWDGVRDDLGKKGVVFDLDVLMTPQGVLSGGRDTGSDFWGNAFYTLNVDTQKLGLWPGGFFKVSANTSFGNSIQNNVGGIIPINTGQLTPEFVLAATGLENLTFMQFLSPKFGVLIRKIFTLAGVAGEFAGNYRTQWRDCDFTGASECISIRQKWRISAAAEA